MEKIKELRETSGAGMLDCKKALDEACGDFDKALEILRKKGITKASKRSDRDASEGIIKLALSEDKKNGYIVELNSETDFVARNEKFQELADGILELLKNNKDISREDLLALKLKDFSLEEEINNLSGVIGEKIS